MTQSRKNFLVFFTLLGFFVALSVGFLFFEPEQLVERLGPLGTYGLLFVASLFGGFSIGGSAAFIALLLALASAGENPWYLGLVGGIGLSIGDSALFYLLLRGRKVLSGRFEELAQKLARIFSLRKIFRKATPIFSYLYMGFTPFPNDVLLAFLATVKYSPRAVWAVLFLADITLVTMLSFFGEAFLVWP